MRKTHEPVVKAFLDRVAGRSGKAFTDGETYTLHQTPIAQWRGNSLWIQTDGWTTNTTLSYLNSMLEGYGANFRVRVNSRKKQSEKLVLTDETSGRKMPWNTRWIEIDKSLRAMMARLEADALRDVVSEGCGKKHKKRADGALSL